MPKLGGIVLLSFILLKFGT